MKKLIVTLSLVLFANMFYGQTVFDKFDNQDDISAFVVNKKMFELMSKVEVKDKESKQYMELISKLDNLKVFVTQNTKKAADMRNTADKFVKTSGLEELMRVTDKGKNVRIYVKSGAGDTQIKELLMFVEGASNNETVLMSLTGNFDLDELSVLTDKMKLPGGDDLKKASKSKK
jgi:hypothetical protein